MTKQMAFRCGIEAVIADPLVEDRYTARSSRRGFKDVVLEAMNRC
jgi:hypothetical protein